MNEALKARALAAQKFRHLARGWRDRQATAPRDANGVLVHRQPIPVDLLELADAGGIPTIRQAEALGVDIAVLVEAHAARMFDGAPPPVFKSARVPGKVKERDVEQAIKKALPHEGGHTPAFIAMVSSIVRAVSKYERSKGTDNA